MDERIVQGLQSQFEKHRIVFWYDSKKEMREQFDTLEMSGIEKLELNNNEFSIKYRILRKHPKQKFLIYNLPIPLLIFRYFRHPLTDGCSIFEIDLVTSFL